MRSDATAEVTRASSPRPPSHRDIPDANGVSAIQPLFLQRRLPNKQWPLSPPALAENVNFTLTFSSITWLLDGTWLSRQADIGTEMEFYVRLHAWLKVGKALVAWPGCAIEEDVGWSLSQQPLSERWGHPRPLPSDRVRVQPSQRRSGNNNIHYTIRAWGKLWAFAE